MDSDEENDLFDEVDGRDPSEAEDEQDEDNNEQGEDGDEDMSEGDEGSGEDESDEDGDDEEGDEEQSDQDAGDDDQELDEETMDVDNSERVATRARSDAVQEPTLRHRSLSPAQARRAAIYGPVLPARTYTIEPVVAIPHPVATHCLAASLCMSHLLTGSQDGYIRDYDIFASCNGKTFLTAPQRHHCGLGDASMKAGTLRGWWASAATGSPHESIPPVYSMAVHSDALWGLSGNAEGKLSLFTIRHDPGRVAHVINAHAKAISAMTLAPDEKSVYTASWDSLAIQWDLNKGENARTFVGHTAQLTAVSVRPLNTLAGYSNANAPAPNNNDDAKSEASYDDLFDEDAPPKPRVNGLSLPGAMGAVNGRGIPVLDPNAYCDFSQDMLMTASIDGQVVLWDRRVRERVGRLDMGDKCPPWCISAVWSADGSQIYAGRRNGSIDVWDVRQLGLRGQGTPRVLKILRNPLSSGPVSCVAAFPDGRHIACASNDNIRLWNVHEADTRPRSLGFKIIAGHHGGIVSQILVDRGCRFMITASGDRGWLGESTKTILIHDIKRVD